MRSGECGAIVWLYGWARSGLGVSANQRVSIVRTGGVPGRRREGGVMASGFQRSKIAGVFEAMDRDRRGALVEGDFVALAERWTTLRGLTPGSEQYARLRAVMLGWWSSLASASRDGARATLDDVMAVVDQLPGMLDAVNATADAMF